MKPEIARLIELSQEYGRNKRYVIGGGGNTSYKDASTIWIKTSGTTLAEMTEEGLAELSRERLRTIATRTYSDDPLKREAEVKTDLFRSLNKPETRVRPSVETSLHELLPYSYVVHLHPTLVNGVLCSRNARSTILKLFGESVLFVSYTDPGYTLFKKMESEIAHYTEHHGKAPQIIFLENHGVFAAADTADEIRHIYTDIERTISGLVSSIPDMQDMQDHSLLHEILPGMRMMLSGQPAAVIRHRHNELSAKYYGSQQDFHRISIPLTPDIIVYCRAKYLYIDHSDSAFHILESLRMQLERFRKEYGYDPKIIVIRGMGVFAVEETVSAADSVLDVFEDMMVITEYASAVGGTKPLTPDQVQFIDQWEAESYRRNVSHGSSVQTALDQKIAIVTGGAQGFGAGIAEGLFAARVNVVISDINEAAGKELAARLNTGKHPNRAVFVRADVSDADSVQNLVRRAVELFGGLDIMISNAGILKAGGLDEMKPEDFTRVTNINYTGYFNCVKFASEAMKRQNAEKPDYFCDIIQINSKSGLRGSNRNFAYAGAKFGGIGLTQSFALELAPHRIKVNAVCPGNFYEGPLWSDPVNGLFVQYLKTGKVPGAKNIDEVRQFYENQVPLKRGCRVEDLLKAIFYIVEQEYETGQAVPVTGGQVMLS